MSDEIKRLEKIKDFCIEWLDPKYLEDGKITAAERLTLEGVWKVGEFGTLPHQSPLSALIGKCLKK